MGKIDYLVCNFESILLLVIDQSEELLTLCQSQKEREDFLNLLADLLTKYPQKLHIVLTLRSDFEPQLRDAIESTHWQKAWQQGRFFVTPMNREELQQAIEEPAAQRTLFFESPKLVNQLIDEVIDTPGALPLLSFTLSELYLKYLQAEENRERDDRTITEVDYRELGGVTRSLTQTADNTYEEVKNENVKESTIRNVMLRMVAISSGELARRRVPMKELEYPESINEQVKIIIDRFVAARLLTIGLDTEGREYVEPVHDVLVTGWQKLLTWKQEMEESLLLQRRLTPAAEEWNSINSKKRSLDVEVKTEPVIDSLDRRLYSVENLINKISPKFIRLLKRSPNEPERSREKPEQYLWNASPYLDVLNQEVLNSSQNNWLNQVETEFVQKSVKRRQRNIQARWTIASIVMVGLSGLTIWALLNLRTARIQEISTLIEISKNNLQANNQLDAIVEAIKAQKKLDNFWIGKDQLSPKVRGILSQTIHHNQQGWKEGLRLPGSRVTLSRYGKLIATKNDDTAQIWNARTGKLLQTLSGHTEELNSIVFSPNGQQLAIASSDDKVLIWDTQKKKYLPSFKGQAFLESTSTGRLINVVFSPDSQQLATISNEQVVIRDAQTGALLHDLSLEEASEVSSLAFSPKSKYLAAALNNRILMWNARTGERLPDLEKEEVDFDSVVFSPNGKYLAASSFDKKNSSGTFTVQVWNIKNGTELYDAPLKHEDIITSIVFGSDSQQIATASLDKTARVWDVQTGELLQTLQGHTEGIRSMILSPNKRKLATASKDKTARVWDVQTGELLQTLQGHTDIVFNMAFGPDSKQLATVSQDLTVRLWDYPSRKILDIFHYHFNSENESIVSKSSIFSPNGKFLATRSENKVWVRDVSTGKDLPYSPLEYDNYLISIVFSPDSQKLLIAPLETEKVQVRDVQTGNKLSSLKGHQDLLAEETLVFSPDGKFLATASSTHEDGKHRQTVRIWNASTGEELYPDSPLKYDRSIFSMAFSHDGKSLAAAFSGKEVSIRDISTGKELYPPLEYTNLVQTIAFSPDGRQLATAHEDLSLQVTDIKTTKQLTVLRGHKSAVESVAFSYDGNFLVTTSADGTVRTWRIGDKENLLAIGCNWVRHYLESNPDLDESDRTLCDSIPPKAIAQD